MLNVITPSLETNNTALEGSLSAVPDREPWIAAQRHAFELALSDFPLADCLKVLIDSAITLLGAGARGAFYLAGDGGQSLHHIVGMPDAYALDVDGARIGPESLACGLAVHVGEPILTVDVRNEPRWQEWRWLAEKWDYRGCWSFPIYAKTGRCIGAFAIYWQDPRSATAKDLDHAALMTQTAAILISRHLETEERRRVESSLREARAQLELELADSELLRRLSLELADEDDENAIYVKLVDAAARIMKSDVCTVQFFHPDRGPSGELQMLASTGLDARGVEYWAWVRGDSGCTCGEVLRTGKRAIAEEVATCSFMAGKPDRDVLLAGGIQAGQSTPLITRNGKLVGMISTHWGEPHCPTDRELRMLDLLARPAADMIERKREAQTQRLLLNELNHRVKNTLAVVQAMATRTLASTSDPKQFSKKFGGRVQALARIHDLLSAKSWEGADLRELIRDQVSAGPADERRVIAEGPSVQLDPQMALHVALILHELGTNATKYGALSTPDGRVTLNWTVDDGLHLLWTERGGPRVEPISSEGFGTTLITQSAKGQGGEAVLIQAPEGVSWALTFPYSGNSAQKPAPERAAPKSPGRPPILRDNLAGQRILVVEDEPLIGLDIIAALEDAEALFDGPIADIDQACNLIGRVQFDAALVDANLHGRPVDQIVAALAARGIPFAFATGYDRDGLPNGYRDRPILRKPCAADEVVKMIVQLIEK